VEPVDEHTSFDKIWDACLDGGYVTLSALLKGSRAVVLNRAMVLAEGTFCNC
jgi:hypothetical protein